MKRHMPLIREILRAVEARENLIEPFRPEIEGFTDDEVSYHIMLLCQAGLVSAMESRELGRFSKWRAVNLTWAGHEFLDAARSDTVWQKAWGKVGTTVPSIGFDILKELLTRTVKDQLGLP